MIEEKSNNKIENIYSLVVNEEDARICTDFPEDACKNTLESHPDVRWTLLFFHKPIWLAAEYEGDGKAAYDSSRWSDIESLLSDRKYTVFAGHVHRYTHRVRQQRDYITLATMGGGSALRGPVFGQFDHVMWVTMTDDGPILANLMLDGIWDIDFSAEDIEKNLYLLIHGKAVKTITEFNDEKPLLNQPVKLRLTNLRDLPMEVSLILDNSEHISFSPKVITKTIEPNSVGTVIVNLNVINRKNEPWPPIWDELRNLQVRWKVTYEFKKYGKIVVNGAKDIL